MTPPISLSAPSQARRCDIAAGLFLLLLTLFHIWYAGRHELLQDEAYYWQWARHPDWGFYDNTPLAAVVIRGFVAVFGSTALGVRLGAIVSALVASLFIYLLAKRLLGPPVALLSIIVANVMPLFAAGAVIMTHDPVQLALWAAALYVVHRALTDRPRWWIGAGILAGLAAQAKLNALLLLPGVFLYLLLSPAMRERWLRRPQPYIAGLAALAIFAPFLWWNHTHVNAFWTHIHAMGSRAGMHDPPLKWTLRFLGDQALVLSPLLFLTYLYALWDAGRRGIKSAYRKAPRPNSGEQEGLARPSARYENPTTRVNSGEPDEDKSGLVLGGLVNNARSTSSPAPQNWGGGAVSKPFHTHSEEHDDALLFLWCPSVVVFAAVVVVTLRSKVEANWAVAAYVSGSILIAAVLYRAWQSRRAAPRAWAGLSAGLAVLLAAATLFPSLLYSVGIKFHDPQKDRTNELYGWRAMAARITQEQSAMRPPDGAMPFVFGINYRMPSEAAFYLPGQPQTYSLFLHDRANEYMFWEDPRLLAGRDAVFVNDTDTHDHFDDLRAVFRRVDPQPPLQIYRPNPYGNVPVRTVQIVRCYGFRGYNPRAWQQGW